MSDLKAHLELMNSFIKSHAGQHHKFYSLLLQFGISCTPKELPNDVQLGTERECFRNASLLALESDYIYVEGYAFNLIATHHAWCIDKQGNVVDPTWGEIGKEYLGIPFKTDFLRKYLVKSGYYGIFDSPYIIRNINKKHIYNIEVEKYLHRIVENPKNNL
jgi:hypothetical protein